MTTLAPVSITPASWTMVYDASANGDFAGLVSTSGSGGAWLIVAHSMPSTSLFGTYCPASQVVSLSAANNDKLYMRSASGNTLAVMDSSLAVAAITSGSNSGGQGVALTQTESAIKSGRMFEASWSAPSIGAGTGAVITIKTGASEVILKEQIAWFDGASIITQIYRDAVTSDGVEPPRLNLNDVTQTLAGTVISQSPIITEFGNPCAADRYALAGEVSRAPERILKPNTNYIIRVVNDTDAPQRISGYLSWIE